MLVYQRVYDDQLWDFIIILDLLKMMEFMFSIENPIRLGNLLREYVLCFSGSLCANPCYCYSIFSYHFKRILFGYCISQMLHVWTIYLLYIYPKNGTNVGKYSIHGAFGYDMGRTWIFNRLEHGKKILEGETPIRKLS